jgi:DNA-directed RNA polymerase sigma subunit (sigma70/sigma32)
LIEVAVEDGGFTLEEIAALMGGLCRERIRQIEEVAMRKIRRVGKSTGLDTEWQHEWDRRAG